MLSYDWPDDAYDHWPSFKDTHSGGMDALRCRCGCGAWPDWAFMDRLQSIRYDCGFPLLVISGARCPAYNATVSTTGMTGPHTTGRAVDISIAGTRAYTLLAAAIERGMTGIGIAQSGIHAGRFIHIDLLEESDKRPWVWSYR